MKRREACAFIVTGAFTKNIKFQIRKDCSAEQISIHSSEDLFRILCVSFYLLGGTRSARLTYTALALRLPALSSECTVRMWIRAPLSVAANNLELRRDSENRQMKLFSVVLIKPIKKCPHAEAVEVSIESRITLAQGQSLLTIYFVGLVRACAWAEKVHS